MTSFTDIYRPIYRKDIQILTHYINITDYKTIKNYKNVSELFSFKAVL